MTIEDWPIHWTIVFQVLVITAIFLVAAQIKMADIVDHLRHHDTDRWLFRVRKGLTFAKLLALCWTVEYSYTRGWQPWPPISMFLLAFNLRVVSELFVMKADIERLRRLAGLSGRTI